MYQNYAQKGVALLSVLMLLVAVMVLVASISLATKSVMRQGEIATKLPSLEDKLDAQAYLAVQTLNAQTSPLYRLPTHLATIKISDELAKFNLNSLYYQDKPNATAHAVFMALLEALAVQTPQAKQWADELTDYLDPDAIAQNGQPEPVGIYANAPIRTANELLYLPNMTGEVLAEILPFVTAHQVENDRDIAINVNSVSALVLSAITQGGVGVGQLRPILAKQQTGFKTTEEFWQTAPLSSYQEPTLTQSQEKRFVNKTALTTTQTHVVGITITVLENERQKSAFYLLKNTATDDTQKKFVVIAKHPVYP